MTPLALALASGVLFSQTFVVDANAQTTTTTDATAPKNPSAPAESLESVTVTARKVAERQQDVPLSITTVTGQTLQDSNSVNLYDVARLTPGLTVSSSSSERNVTLTIRGLPDLSGGAADPNVAVFIDGIYQSNRSAISIGLLDLQRIEVIKGPVSALYGRNAYAGVLNYVTTPPQNRFEAGLLGQFGTYGLRDLRASIGGPLGSDAVLGRLVVSHEEFEGTYHDRVNGLHVGGYRKDDVLGTLTIKPTDRFTIGGSFYHGNDFFDQPAAAYLNNNCGARSAAATSPGQFTQLCGKIDPRANPVEVAQLNAASGATGNNREVFANSIRFGYDLNYLDATVLLGYNKVVDYGFADFTGHRNGIPFTTQFAVAGGFVPGPIVYMPETFGGRNNNEDGSGEFRLATKQNQPLRASAGVYLFRARSTSTTVVGVDGSPLAANQSITPAFYAPLVTATGGFNDATAYTQVNQTDRIFSPFLSAEYDILPNLTALVEGRQTNERKSQDIVRNLFCPGIICATGVNAPLIHPYGAAGTVATEQKFHNYRTGLRYKILPDWMTYLSVADGTKAGGFNQRATIPSEIAFGPEKNTTFEVGTKATFLNNRAAIGLSLFHVNARGVQITGPSDDPRNAGLVTKNLASVKTSGADIDLSVVPLRGLTLTLGVGLSSPKLGANTYDYSNAAVCLTLAQCASRVTVIQTAQGPRTVVDLKGLQAPRTSKGTASFATQYNGQITDQLAYFARADFHYESKQWTTPIQYNYIGAKKVVNLNAGISTDHYRLTAFVRNLTNDQTPDGAFANGLVNGGATPWVAYLPATRSAGLTLGIDY